MAGTPRAAGDDTGCATNRSVTVIADLGTVSL